MSEKGACLNCGAPMATSLEHGITIDYCTDCGGVWLDPGELEELTGSRYHFGPGTRTHHPHADDIDEEDEEESDGFLDSVVDALGGGDGGDGGDFGGGGDGGED